MSEVIHRHCPECRATLRLTTAAIGHKARCPRCGHVFDVSAENRATAAAGRGASRSATGAAPTAPPGREAPVPAPADDIHPRVPQPISVEEVFRVGWAAFAQNPAEMCVWGLIMFLAQLGVGFAIELVKAAIASGFPTVPFSVTSSVGQALSYVAFAPPLAATVYVALLACRGKPKGIGAGFHVAPRLLAILVQATLFALVYFVVLLFVFMAWADVFFGGDAGPVAVTLLVCAVIAAMLLCIPLTGIYYFAVCSLVDGSGVLGSCQFGIRMLKVNLWPTLLLSVVSYVLATAGVIVCCVGLVLTVPLTMCFFAAAYVVGTGQPTLKIVI